MAVNSGDERPNVHSVVVSPDGGAAKLQYEHLSNVSYAEVLNMMKSSVCSNAEPISQNNTDQRVDKVNSHLPCSSDIDIEMGKEDFASNEESTVNWKSDDYLARDACLQNGGKFVQLLMNLGFDFSKFTLRDKLSADRVYDTPTHRTRKYKRYPSFSSRRVVLLFSVLSSVGTIILIYLTLRVRQINNGTGNV